MAEFAKISNILIKIPYSIYDHIFWYELLTHQSVRLNVDSQYITVELSCRSAQVSFENYSLFHFLSLKLLFKYISECYTGSTVLIPEIYYTNH